MEIVFPALVGNIDASKLTSIKSICSDDHFRKYFQLSVPTGKIADADFEQVISASNNADRLFALLQTYQAQNKEKSLLSGLRKRVKLFDPSHVKNAIVAFLSFADLCSNENDEFWGVATSNTSFFLAINLFKSADFSKREGIFEDIVFQQKRGKCQLIRFVEYIGREHGFLQAAGQQTLLSDSEKYISLEVFDKVKAACIDMIDRLDIYSNDFDELVSNSGMASMWFALERMDYKNLDILRSRIFGVKNGVLRVFRHFTGRVLSSNDGKCLQINFESIRMFMGEKITNEKIIEMAETQIKSCDDPDLINEIREGIKNALDPDK